MTRSELKLFLEEFSAGQSGRMPDNTWIKFGGSEARGGNINTTIRNILSNGDQDSNTKFKFKTLPYPMTDDTADQFADACIKIKDLNRLFKKASKNPSNDKKTREILESISKDFNVVFTKLINMAEKIDKIND